MASQFAARNLGQRWVRRESECLPPLIRDKKRTNSHLVSRKIDIDGLIGKKGLRSTEQRKVIARVLSESEDHPDVGALHARAAAIDNRISISTVYRTLRLFEEAGVLERHEFGDGRTRYEAAAESHHDHLIDLESGKVIEFADDELETLQRRVAEKLGFRLVDHRVELYGVALDRD